MEAERGRGQEERGHRASMIAGCRERRPQEVVVGKAKGEKGQKGSDDDDDKSREMDGGRDDDDSRQRPCPGGQERTQRTATPTHADAAREATSAAAAAAAVVKVEGDG